MEYARRKSESDGYLPGEVDIQLKSFRKQDGAAVGSAGEYEAKFIWRVDVMSMFGELAILRMDKKASMSAETLRNNGVMIPEVR